REDHEEDHQGPVDREELVVRMRGEDLCARPCELAPHQEREDPGDREEREAVDQVQEPDLLVVRRREPVEEPSPLRPRRLLPGRDLRYRPRPLLTSSWRRRTRPTWLVRARRTGSSSDRVVIRSR